jgi:type 1 glutamine amidotransferase
MLSIPNQFVMSLKTGFKKLLLGSASLLCLLAVALHSNPAPRLVLVYTRTSVTARTSYIHDNRAATIEAIRKMGKENHFEVEASIEPSVFTEQNLARYGTIVIANTNNDLFTTEDQRKAFQRYIERGGGLVGLHSASTSEKDWPFYWQTIGGKFVRHPKKQTFTVRLLDATHPATRHMPASFEWEEEAYFHNFLNPDMHVLLDTDPNRLEDPVRAQHPADLFSKSLPLAWTITTNGVRVFYTVLGHNKEAYSNPILYQHILGGIQWALRDQQ